MEKVELWHGRYDGDAKEDLSLWQVVRPYVEKKAQGGICFVGYDTDEGIERNKGRKGAALGSNAIRQAMQSLPYFGNVQLFDCYNLTHKKTEEAQAEYAGKVAQVLRDKMLPVGLGGGHDIAFGSYTGIRQVYGQEKLGLVNIDAHLDMRDYSQGRTSGTSFKEIMDGDRNAFYANVGFKKQGNTARLMAEAEKHKALILPEALDEKEMLEGVRKFAQEVDLLYITFCMDVFDVCYAPGVSAPTVMGMAPRRGRAILRELLSTQKVVCVDFAEVSPPYDFDGRTARLAATLAYEVLTYFTEQEGK